MMLYIINISIFIIMQNLEKVYTLKSFPMSKCKKILEKSTITVLGYGPQGKAQSLNLRDNGFSPIVGLRKNGPSWNEALIDGWEPNKTLFEIDEAVYRGNIIQYLLSDAGQMQTWNTVKSNLHANDTLYFSHGFGIVYEQTGIVPPDDIDVVLVAPKGPGGMLRRKFLDGNGMFSSFAVHQNYSGNAFEKALALSFGIGSGNVFETTFKKEVYSDLTGERSVLMGLIQGAFKAQYDILRSKGHGPLEAYNETVEEALVSLYPLINERGMDWMYKNCSTTAQVGAIKWGKEFEKELKPIIEKCYDNVANGNETNEVLKFNSDPDYRKKLNDQLDEIENDEIWQVGKYVRSMR
jgi:ketol-acid reductoisomerase